MTKTPVDRQPRLEPAAPRPRRETAAPHRPARRRTRARAPLDRLDRDRLWWGMPSAFARLASRRPEEHAANCHCAETGGTCAKCAAESAEPEAERSPEEQTLRELGPGERFEGQPRSRMELAFGESFADVRIHTDERAAQAADRLQAHAFAVGSHVAFGRDRYRPGTPLGDALLAHELAHTLQQRDAGPEGEHAEAPPRFSIRAADEAPLERDADRAALGVMGRLWSHRLPGSETPPTTALPRLKTGLRISLASCKGGGKKASCTGTPVSMKKVTSGAFEGGKTMADYFPDLVGMGLWDHGGTAGPWDTGTNVGSNVQLIGEIPADCDQKDFTLEQTVHFATASIDGTKHPKEGQTWDDIAASTRDQSRAPFRQVWDNKISMADPPSIAYSSLTEVDLDRDFVTSLRGSGGKVSVNWSTSIRIRGGAVTRNTIT